MASDSSRARIDQFFSSKKKRKILSPAAKSGRPEKEAKTQSECSPSAKGSLETYLETSPTKCVNSVLDEKARAIPVKRNLTLETGLIYSRDENSGAPLKQPQSSEASGVAKKSKNESLSGICNEAVEGVQHNSSITGAYVQNSTLKEFATGFLSLYCSELRSSASLPSETNAIVDKRHSSSSALRPEEESPGRHFKKDENPSEIQNESISTPKAWQSKLLEEPVGIGSNCLEKDIACNPFTSQASLRKCNNRPALCTAECETPASFQSRLGARETPQSTRGSSSFSPGDAFWNEAITIADGLVNPNAGLSFHVAEKNEVLKGDYETHNSNNVKSRGCVHLLNSARDGVTDSVCDGAVSAVGSLGMHVKDLDKEASPLPVKHFDFSFESKSIDYEIPADASNTKPGILRTKETPASTNQHNSQNYNLMGNSLQDQVCECP